MTTLNHPISRMVARIAEAICLSPIRPEVSEATHAGRTLIRLTSDSSDYGAVCGRNGTCINAIKKVVEKSAELSGSGAAVSLEERPFSSAPNVGTVAPMTNKEIQTLLDEVVALAFDRALLDIAAQDSQINVRIFSKDTPMIAAVHEIFYAIGKRHGFTVKIRPAESRGKVL